MNYRFFNQLETKFINKDIHKDCVNIADIIYIEYEENKAKINLKNKKIIYDIRTLKEIREELYKFGFYLIDRSTLVNLRYITEIDTTKKGKYWVKFAKIKKDISVRKQKELDDLLNNNQENCFCPFPNCPFLNEKIPILDKK